MYPRFRLFSFEGVEGATVPWSVK